MIKNKTNLGLFISMEGPEGAGKSTQAAMLAEWLLTKGIPVLLTREPGDGAIGAQIRRIILDPQNKALTAKAEAMLYAADRAQHVECVLQPALKQGVVVVCDRYVDSNIAYQGYGRGIDLGFLKEINEMATIGLMPDVTILLDLAPEVGLQRVKEREAAIAGKKATDIDRIEQETLAFHQRLCQGYHEIAAQEPARVQVVDASMRTGAIKEEIRKIVSSKLMQHGFLLETPIFDD